MKQIAIIIDGTRIDLSGRANVDLSEAVERDHYCSDASCDIREALENGFPMVAAHHLMGATECETVERVVAHYGIDFRGIHDSVEWQNWMEHFTEVRAQV